MVKADSNVGYDKQLFNADDDDQSDIQLERGSVHQSQLDNDKDDELKNNQ